MTIIESYSVPIQISDKGVVFLVGSDEEQVNTVAELLNIGIETTVLMKRMEEPTTNASETKD
jgi:hypothetical protein